MKKTLLSIVFCVFGFAASVQAQSNNPDAATISAATKNYDVVLYPNPAVNEVNVSFSENADIKTITIYNIIGNAVISTKPSGNSNRLDITKLPTGVYFIRFLNDQGELVATRKFNKQ